MLDSFDFLLKSNDKKPKNKETTAKRIALIVGAVVTFICFIFIVIASYRFVNTKPLPTDVPLIRAKTHKIKIIPKNQKKSNINNLDIEIYNNISNDSPELSEKELLVVKSSEKLVNEEGIDLEKKINEISDEGMSIAQNNIKKKEQKDVLYQKLEKDLNNKMLIKNIKEGKALKPSIKVQLAALKSKSAAVAYWKNIQKKDPSFFNNKFVFFEKIDLKQKGVFYRLQVGNFNNVIEAKDFCKQYTSSSEKRSSDCIIIKP